MKTHVKLDGRPKGHGAASRLTIEWNVLCNIYLPITSTGSIWRYSRCAQAGDIKQGWKLHISATILSANKVLGAAAPYLKRRGVLFKAPQSLLELQRLNSGLSYGYSQVGKFITVYPRSPKEAVSLARRLHHLTAGMPGPSVPFDLRFLPRSNIYYRYGSFKPLEVQLPNGERTAALLDTQDNPVPDSRYSESGKPDWVVDPFVNTPVVRTKPRVKSSPLYTTFRVFHALSQRGKGGVYKAVDFSQNPPRLCVLKQGRRFGETSWDGRDGSCLVRHEEKVLRILQAAGIKVPEVYGSFTVHKNHYLVIEFIEGESLHCLLARRQRRLPIRRALGYASDIAILMSRLHAIGWVWRDCKPTNILVTKDGSLRALDFEGACPTRQPDSRVWATTAFTPPSQGSGKNHLWAEHSDLYALGATTYYLLSGRMPSGQSPIPLDNFRRGIPKTVCKLIHGLLCGKSQTAADDIFQTLKGVPYLDG